MSEVPQVRREPDLRNARVRFRIMIGDTGMYSSRIQDTVPEWAATAKSAILWTARPVVAKFATSYTENC